MKNYPPAMYQNGISKEKRSHVTGKIDNSIPLLCSDSATTSKRKKNRRDTFKFQIKEHCLSLKAQNDVMFRNREKSGFLLKPLKAMFDHVVDRLSLQQLEYEMERADLPDDYIFFKIGYCGHPAFLYARIQLKEIE